MELNISLIIERWQWLMAEWKTGGWGLHTIWTHWWWIFKMTHKTCPHLSCVTLSLSLTHSFSKGSHSFIKSGIQYSTHHFISCLSWSFVFNRSINPSLALERQCLPMDYQVLSVNLFYLLYDMYRSINRFFVRDFTEWDLAIASHFAFAYPLVSPSSAPAFVTTSSINIRGLEIIDWSEWRWGSCVSQSR